MITQKKRPARGERSSSFHFMVDFPYGRDIAALVVLCLAFFLLRVGYVVFATPYGLAPDEAQYWHWLSHNDWSFLTKPPLTTWLMGVSTYILGDTLLGVKFFALLGQVAMPALGFLMAREIAGRVAGWWAFALLLTVPLAAAGGLIMSPDALLLPLWLGALYCLVRAVQADDARALCWGRWLLIGVLVGLAGLAKYSAAFFFPLLGLYMLLFRRAWFRAPQVWLSGVVALAFQLPVLLWNIQHDWVGLAHVIWQADGGGDARHGGLGTLLEFLGSQAGVIGPVVFGLMLAAWLQGTRNQERGTRKEKAGAALLVVFTLPVFAVFAAMTFHGKVQPNWPVLATLPALILVAVWLVSRNEERGTRNEVLLRVAAVGVALNAVLSVMLMDVPFFRAAGVLPISAKIDPTKDLQGWPELGQLLGVVLREVQDPVLVTSRYQTAAPLAFHVPGKPVVLYINAEGRRANQYDLWEWPDLTNRVAVYVSERPVIPEALNAKFTACAPWRALGVEAHGEVVRRISTWVCWGAK